MNLPLAWQRKTGLNSSHVLPVSSPMSRSLILRSLWLPSLILGIGVVLALALVSLSAWRAESRMQVMQGHMQHILALQQLALHIEQDTLRPFDPHTPLSPAVKQMLDGQLTQILNADQYRAADTPAILKQLRSVLALPSANHATLLNTLNQIRQRITAEIGAHGALVNAVQQSAQLEFKLTLGLAAGLPLLILAILFLLRHQVSVPLRDLGQLMHGLSRQNYASAPTQHAGAMIKPLLLRYNHLVSRLAELEAEHQNRETTLEQQVRDATGTLLAQQLRLAQAEKLATVGEVAAGIAHELRNPLSGIQLALVNLRSETSSPDHLERLDLVLDELNRINRLLNGLLDQARHRPEAASAVCLADLCQAVAALARYQLPTNIRLKTQISDNLHCLLPADGLRQALLNLILNARNALASAPGIIRLQAQRSDADSIELTVIDNGPGFPAVLLNSAARPFLSGHESGTGLGLAVTRRFINGLGGHLALTNQPGGGARVSLRIPCPAASESA